MRGDESTLEDVEIDGLVFSNGRAKAKSKVDDGDAGQGRREKPEERLGRQLGDGRAVDQTGSPEQQVGGGEIAVGDGFVVERSDGAADSRRQRLQGDRGCS